MWKVREARNKCGLSNGVNSVFLSVKKIHRGKGFEKKIIESGEFKMEYPCGHASKTS